MLTDQTFVDTRPWIGIGPELFLDANDPTGFNADAVYVCRTALQPNTFCRFMWIEAVDLDQLRQDPAKDLVLNLARMGIHFPLKVRCEQITPEAKNWVSQCWCAGYSDKFFALAQNNLPTTVLMNVPRNNFLALLVECNIALCDITKAQFLARLYGH